MGLLRLKNTPSSSAKGGERKGKSSRTAGRLDCPRRKGKKGYEQATGKGESISRIVYIAPRPANPDLRTESWNFYVVDAQVAPGNPKPVANLIVTRTTDTTGHILPGAQAKISFQCELIPH